LIQRILKRFLTYWRILVLKVRYYLFGIEIVNEALLQTTIGASHILRSFGASVGRRSVVHSPLVIHNAEKDYSNLLIGSNVHIGRNVFLDLTDTITVDDRAVVSMDCALLTHQDVGNRPLQSRYPRKMQPLHIGENAYLGIRVTLLAGANIGESTVVGAGAVVLNSISDHNVVVGIPAKKVEFVAKNKIP
jgi:acetyltransferase-like isoleucine patch superfamily enzyme